MSHAKKEAERKKHFPARFSRNWNNSRKWQVYKDFMSFFSSSLHPFRSTKLLWFSFHLQNVLSLILCCNVSSSCRVDVKRKGFAMRSKFMKYLRCSWHLAINRRMKGARSRHRCRNFPLTNLQSFASSHASSYPLKKLILRIAVSGSDRKKCRAILISVAMGQVQAFTWLFVWTFPLTWHFPHLRIPTFCILTNLRKINVESF